MPTVNQGQSDLSRPSLRASRKTGPQSRLAATCIRAASLILGPASLVLFLAYPRGFLPIMPQGWGMGAALAWDSLLSAVFFLQHSVMIRRRIRARLETYIPPASYMAVYSIASALVLIPIALLWQRVQPPVYSIAGPARFIIHGLSILALAGFAWGMFSLRPFDPFGVAPLTAHLRGRAAIPTGLVVRGPYRWVRHPLYSCFIALLWLHPDPTIDILFCNTLWTFWIVLGTVLEERDMVTDFGDSYSRYQREVPMFIPWRGRLWGEGNVKAGQIQGPDDLPR
jgi:protein-S-isoprenylcysteine O-methyltransferase Ste14